MASYHRKVVACLCAFQLGLPAVLAEKQETNPNQFDMSATEYGTGYGEQTIGAHVKKSGPVFANAKLYRAWLEKYHPDLVGELTNVSPQVVVEVKGIYDNSHKPLSNLGIPHTSISVGKFKNYDLATCKVLIVDCPGKLSHDQCQKVRDFVTAGGALITTDWSLRNTLEVAFPGYLQWNLWKSSAEVVDARPTVTDSELSVGLGPPSSWCIEINSYAIRVLRPSVTVLATSAKLARQEPDRRGILACSFPFGRGRVLHLIGHYGMNALFMLMDPSASIGISMRQALISNFIINALKSKS